MKKAQGLSLTTIIVAAIGLMVLVVLIALFTGRIGPLSEEKQKDSGTVGLVLEEPKTKDWYIYYDNGTSRSGLESFYLSTGPVSSAIYVGKSENFRTGEMEETFFSMNVQNIDFGKGVDVMLKADKGVAEIRIVNYSCVAQCDVDTDPDFCDRCDKTYKLEVVSVD